MDEIVLIRCVFDEVSGLGADGMDERMRKHRPAVFAQRSTQKFEHGRVRLYDVDAGSAAAHSKPGVRSTDFPQQGDARLVRGEGVGRGHQCLVDHARFGSAGNVQDGAGSVAVNDNRSDRWR